MKKIVSLISVLGIALLMGCQQANNQNVGMLAGGIAGGILGHQIGGGTGKTIATVGGTLLGAYIGGAIGKSMDEQDRMKMQRTLENQPTGQATSWRNPDRNASYQVTPTRTYQGSQGQPCREFQTVATIGGKKEQMYGKACRQADGSWKQVS